MFSNLCVRTYDGFVILTAVEVLGIVKVSPRNAVTLPPAARRVLHGHPQRKIVVVSVQDGILLKPLLPDATARAVPHHAQAR